VGVWGFLGLPNGKNNPPPSVGGVLFFGGFGEGFGAGPGKGNLAKNTRGCPNPQKKNPPQNQKKDPPQKTINQTGEKSVVRTMTRGSKPRTKTKTQQTPPETLAFSKGFQVSTERDPLKMPKGFPRPKKRGGGVFPPNCGQKGVWKKIFYKPKKTVGLKGDRPKKKKPKPPPKNPKKIPPPSTPPMSDRHLGVKKTGKTNKKPTPPVQRPPPKPGKTQNFNSSLTQKTGGGLWNFCP